jgi:FixJ family two-component response regulator
MLQRRRVALASPTDSFDEAMARTRKSACFVAIVDDDASVREGIEGLLNSVGIKTRSFASAEAYLRGNAGAGARCLILDLRLPGMNGLELHRLLRAQGSDLPVIFITAEDDERWRAEMEEAGAVAIFRKPFDPDGLTRAVQAAFDARRLR